MTDIVGKYIEVNNVRAYYESCGAGTPLLLLHTAGRDSRQWHGVMEALADSYLLIAPDLPGHGKSWPLPGNRCFEDITEIANWLRGFMAKVAGGRFCVMGCSLGGNLSLLMPALFNEVLAAVVLQGADVTPSMNEGGLDLLTHPQVSLMHSVMDTTLSLMGRATPQNSVDFARWGVLTVIPLALQGDLRAYIRTNISHLMPKIRVPVLLVRGDKDWIVPEALVQDTRNRITASPRCEFLALEGLGHFPHIEAPARVAEVASTFLSGVS